jgi:hypothetical protein
MHASRYTATLTVLVSALAAGCGGGGSATTTSDTTTSDITTGCSSQGSASSAVASYAGTYTCTSPNVAFTAVLPTATGAFSSCSGSAVNGQLSVSCRGAIGSDGTFNVTGTDDHGNVLTFDGTATATTACGSETSPGGLNTFECQH